MRAALFALHAALFRPPMSSDVQPGLLVLHGNRAELLRDALFEWLQRQPLAPLRRRCSSCRATAWPSG